MVKRMYGMIYYLMYMISSHFEIFLKIIFWGNFPNFFSEFQNFKISKKIFMDQNKCANMFQGVWNDHISSPEKNALIEWHFHDNPQENPKMSQNPIFEEATSLTRSSSGWVPMILKVLPLKSMSSEEYFLYSSYGHIFNTSKLMQLSFKKITPLVCYN